MLRQAKFFLGCINCDHQLEIGRVVANSPFTSIGHVIENISRFRCSKCGSKSIRVVEVRGEKTTDIQKKHRPKKKYPPVKIQHGSKTTVDSGPPRDRFIDEGIAGTREDNKKMRSRQRSTNLSHKF